MQSKQQQQKTTLVNNFFSSVSVFDTCSWEYQCAFLCLQTSRIASGFYVRTRLLHQQHHTHASWYSRKRLSKTDMEEKKLVNTIIFVFFAHKKKYSRSFIKLRLNHWCHMDYFNNVLITFLGLDHGSTIAVYAGSGSSQISSKIS